MPRVKRGTKRSDRRKKILERASGYFLTKSKLYQAAQEAVERGLKFARAEGSTLFSGIPPAYLGLLRRDGDRAGFTGVQGQ